MDCPISSISVPKITPHIDIYLYAPKIDFLLLSVLFHFSASYRWCYDFPKGLKNSSNSFRLFASSIGTRTLWSIHFPYSLVFYQFIIPEMSLMKGTANIGCLLVEWIEEPSNSSWSLPTLPDGRIYFLIFQISLLRWILHSAAPQSFGFMCEWILHHFLFIYFFFWAERIKRCVLWYIFAVGWDYSSALLQVDGCQIFLCLPRLHWVPCPTSLEWAVKPLTRSGCILQLFYRLSSKRYTVSMAGEEGGS